MPAFLLPEADTRKRCCWLLVFHHHLCLLCPSNTLKPLHVTRQYLLRLSSRWSARTTSGGTHLQTGTPLPPQPHLQCYQVACRPRMCRSTSACAATQRYIPRIAVHSPPSAIRLTAHGWSTEPSSPWFLAPRHSPPSRMRATNTGNLVLGPSANSDRTKCSPSASSLDGREMGAYQPTGPNAAPISTSCPIGSANKRTSTTGPTK